MLRPTRRERRRNARELSRRMAELDRLDERHGLGAWPPGPSASQPRKNVGAATVGTLVTLAALALVLAFDDSGTTQAVRAHLGLGQERLGSPPEVPQGDGSFQFLQTQPGSNLPVSYNACEPIRFTVNKTGAPENHMTLVQAAVRHTSEATGFQFQYVGSTDSREFQPGLGPASSAPPVLIAWAGPDEVEELSGDVAGIGGSVARQTRPGLQHYVTGVVVLDANVFAEYDRPDRHALGQAIIDHEFGHLVGLDHVDDAGELMHTGILGRFGYGPGDREGLARLGGTACW